MTKHTRRTHNPAFKAKVVLAAMKGEKTLHAKIGELTLTNNFLSGVLGKAGLLSAKR